MSYCASSQGYSGSNDTFRPPRYSNIQAPSQLERITYNSPGVPRGDTSLYAHSESKSVEAAVKNWYAGIKDGYVPDSSRGTYLSTPKPHTLFIANDFLAKDSTARFVGNAEEIKEYIKEAFQSTTGNELPQDIQITILNNKEFTKAHLDFEKTTNDGVQGFSLNSQGNGTNRIFVRANPLDQLMLTIGHEIGHVLTPSLKNEHDEEAKAFAFSLAWMSTIRENNIAGIGNNILPEPAQNGLHDVAFGFVLRLINDGMRAWEAFKQLAQGTLTIREQPITAEA